MNTSRRDREDFRLAVDGFVEVLRSVPPQDWRRPALGEWTVQDLSGHASRALLTVESYLDPSTTNPEPELPDAVAYFRAVATGLADATAIAERGRQAGAALGQDPAAAVTAMARRILPLVETGDDSARIKTPMGSMTLIGYLPTRTFELAVHSLDLLATTGGDVPANLRQPLTSSLHLAADLAADDGQDTDVLLALTGRRPLPPGFSVLSRDPHRVVPGPREHDAATQPS